MNSLEIRTRLEVLETSVAELKTCEEENVKQFESIVNHSRKITRSIQQVMEEVTILKEKLQ